MKAIFMCLFFLSANLVQAAAVHADGQGFYNEGYQANSKRCGGPR